MIVDHAELKRPARTATQQQVGWKDALLCITMGHLSVLKILADLPPFLGPGATFVQKRMPDPHDYAAVLAIMLAIGGALWLSLQAARQSKALAAKAICWGLWIGASGLALNGIRHIVLAATESIRRSAGMEWRVSGILWSCLAVSLLLAWIASAKMQRLLRGGLLAMSVLLPANLAAVAYYWAKPPQAAGWSEGKAVKGQPLRGTGARRRVVYLLLDEWDYALTFGSRPAGLNLPEFDALQKGSLFATNAVPPGKSTLSSVPSLLAGRVFDEARVTGPSVVSVVEGDEAFAFGESDQMFSRLTAAGYNVAIAGWYLPYCRIVSGQYTECRWWEAGFHGFPKTESFVEAVTFGLRRILESNSRSLVGPPVQSELSQQVDSELVSYAARLIRDPSKDFVYVHLPTLHGPYFYDRRSNDFGLRGSPVSGYWDALYRTSRILGDLRDQLARSEAGERTILLLTSDHSYRYASQLNGKADPRVPFITVFPDDVQGIRYHEPLRTETAHEAVDALLAGEIRSPEEFRQWLAKAKGITH